MQVDVAADVQSEAFISQVTNHTTFFITDEGYGKIKPSAWTSERRAPGELQFARSDLIQSHVRLLGGIRSYENLLDQIEDQVELLEVQFDVGREEINILNQTLRRQEGLNASIKRARRRASVFRTLARVSVQVADAVSEALPKVSGFIAGFSNGLIADFLSGGRSAIEHAGALIAKALNVAADEQAFVELDHQHSKESVAAISNIRLTTLRQGQGIQERLAQLEQLIRQEALQRLEMYTLQETVQQAAGRYGSVLARGQRLLEERECFRAQTAAQTQDYRYKDMAFRIFRNDALQKYRSQFDLAATYVYLTARAYDYETNLRRGGAGSTFMTDIIRARSIGEINNGIPSTSGNDGGLADPMARMIQKLVHPGRATWVQQSPNRNRALLLAFRVVPHQTWAVRRCGLVGNAATQRGRQLARAAGISEILSSILPSAPC